MDVDSGEYATQRRAAGGGPDLQSRPTEGENMPNWVDVACANAVFAHQLGFSWALELLHYFSLDAKQEYPLETKGRVAVPMMDLSYRMRL